MGLFKSSKIENLEVIQQFLGDASAFPLFFLSWTYMPIDSDST